MKQSATMKIKTCLQRKRKKLIKYFYFKEMMKESDFKICSIQQKKYLRFLFIPRVLEMPNRMKKRMALRE